MGGTAGNLSGAPPYFADCLVSGFDTSSSSSILGALILPREFTPYIYMTPGLPGLNFRNKPERNPKGK